MTQTLLTNGQSTGSSATTASISPSANSLVVLIVANTKIGAIPNNPTASWQSVDRPRQFSQVDASDSEIKIHAFPFLAGSSPGSGAITLDFVGQSEDNIMWAIVEVTGIAQTLPLQYAGNDSASSSTGITVTLAAFTDVHNGTVGAIYDKTTRSITAGSGFTELSNQQATGTFEYEYKNSNDTSVDWSWSSASAHVVALAMEIKSSDQTSASASASASLSPSASQSPSASLSSSASASKSASASASKSASASASASLSPSASNSGSPSASQSPSASLSPSSSASQSLSPSSSTSASISPSGSPSASLSDSTSASASQSPSGSQSPSTSPSPGFEDFTREQILILPTNDNDLTTPYTDQEKIDV
jgi:hypothetical protein